MAGQNFQYLIVGAGLAGASAAEGIREKDPRGSLLLLGREPHLPYHRPSLSKGLWTGKDKEPDIFVHDQEFYDSHGATLLLGVGAARLDARQHLVTDDQGRTYGYQKLLLATGGVPRTLPIPGADLPGARYYRTLDDYRALRAEAGAGKQAVVIGGGFIGSELAAALTLNGVHVTMIFPEAYLCQRVLPDGLGRAVQAAFAERGVRVLAGDQPAAITRQKSQLLVHAAKGAELAADLVVIGVGIRPDIELAAQAGLQTGDGVLVNEFLQTSEPDVYAAGDIANYVYPGLNLRQRLEHWDNAQSQGRQAGRNLAGAGEKFSYQPFFFSDLFDFGYEAVGEIDSRLETYADWQIPNRTGVVYYLRAGKVRGVMFCNLPDRIEQARELINRQETISPQALAGRLH